MKTLNNKSLLLNAAVVLILTMVAVSTYSYRKAFLADQNISDPLSIGVKAPIQIMDPLLMRGLNTEAGSRLGQLD